MWTPQAIDWTQAGLLGLVVLAIVWTGIKKVWLWRWVHQEIVESKQAINEVLARQLIDKTLESDEWKRIALTQAGIFERSVETVERVVTRTLGSDEARARRGEVPGDRDPS